MLASVSRLIVASARSLSTGMHYDASTNQHTRMLSSRQRQKRHLISSNLDMRAAAPAEKIALARAARYSASIRSRSKGSKSSSSSSTSSIGESAGASPSAPGDSAAWFTSFPAVVSLCTAPLRQMVRPLEAQRGTRSIFAKGTWRGGDASCSTVCAASSRCWHAFSVAAAQGSGFFGAPTKRDTFPPIHLPTTTPQ